MKLLTLSFLLVSAFIFAGCQATVNTVENKEKSMAPSNVDTSKVITDSFLKGRLAVKSVNKRILPDGLMKVEVSAINTRTGFFSQIGSWFMGDNPYQVIYRFTWLDKDGMIVNNGSNAWIPATVIPGDTLRVTGVSPNTRCRDFTLSIRENIEARNR